MIWYRQKLLIGIKGRIQTRGVELEDETIKKYVEVIAKKVTFLSSNKKYDKEEQSSFFVFIMCNAKLTDY